ncbi:MAG: nucleotide exchange factor GrpE [Methylococcales bacterium]
MSDELQKQDLLADFQDYLQQSKLDQLASNAHPDLSTLLSEMAALKTEVKAESRQFKSTLDTLSSALDTVQENNKTLAANSERLEQKQRELLRNVLLDFVDIYERLSTGLDVLQNYQPVAALFNHSKAQDLRFIKQFTEGQEMLLKRFEQLLQRYQVQAIDCVGKTLNPLTMTAVEIGHDPSLANGIVLAELRKGFWCADQVLRLAEVKVNKLNTR